MATNFMVKIDTTSYGVNTVNNDMKRHGRHQGSCCFVITVAFLALGVLVIALNVLNLIISVSIGHEQYKSTTIQDNTKHFYSVQPLSSSELYYLDKHGYRIALQSEVTADYTINRHRNPTTTDQPQPTEQALSGYDVMHGENEAERDETIDSNQYDPTDQDELVKRSKCNEKNPVKQLVQLKTHRTGSSTLANILYRYGDLNNLQFALPKEHSYEFYWPVTFNPSFVDKQYMNTTKPADMLVNARLRVNSMPLWRAQGSVLITVIRDPVKQFESTFYSYHLDKLFGLDKTSDPLAEFLKSPKQFFSNYLQNAKPIDNRLNLAVNGQMFDLGLRRIYFSDDTIINRTIEELTENIDLVLISEYMDESLILLKRALCWEIDDVLHFVHKQRHADYKDLSISTRTKEQIYQWNHADTVLYKHFNQTLWKKIAQQDSSFYNDLRELKLKRKTLEKECIASTTTDPNTGEIVYKLEPNLSSFNKYLCEKINMNEQEYISYLKTKIKLKYQQEDLDVKKKFQELEDRAYNLSSVQ